MGLAIMATFLLLVYHFENQNKIERGANPTRGEDPTIRAMNTLTGVASFIHSQVLRTVSKNNLGDRNLHQLDFSMPRDPDFGDNPELEVFNLKDEGSHLPFSNDFFLMTTGNPDHSGFIFTLANRIAGLGTSQSDLIAVLPNVRSDLCSRISTNSKHLQQEVYIDDIQNIDLTSFPAEPITPNTIVTPILKTDTGGGCIRTNDGFHYIHAIFKR